VPDTSSLESLRPSPDSDEHPVHRRTVALDVFARDEHLVAIATLRDERPWARADGQGVPRLVHAMELGMVVRMGDMVIVDAKADMEAFPHAECTDIEPTFRDLVGLNVGRGYTGAVQERFGRQRGCSHLEFLARALGPAVVQGVASAAARRFEQEGEGHPFRQGGFTFLANTCHIWRDGGPGAKKVAAGWLPLRGEYPAPRVVEIRRRSSEG
jgi:hypothetical protein